MKNTALLLALLLGHSACSTIKNPTAMKPGQTAQKFHLERKQVLSADYLLCLPQGYDSSSDKRWPLILFLHGSGERGTNVWLVAKHGPPKMGATATNLPFIIQHDMKKE